MAAPTIAHGSAVALGEESTYGTAASRTHLLKVQSHRCDLDIGVEEVPTMGDHTLTAAAPVEFVKTLQTAGGSFVAPFYADDAAILLLFAFLFGAVADGGSGPSSYTHTYTLDNKSASRKFFTAEHTFGDVDQKTMEGCVVTRWSITIEPGRPVMISVEYIAETGAALTTQTALTHAAGEILVGNLGSVLAWNSVNHVPRRVTISCDHGYARRYVVGSAQTLQPVINARTNISVEAELEHGVLTDPEAAYVAETTGDLTISLTAGGGEVHAFTLYNAQIVRGVQRNAQGFGIIPKSILWRGKADAGGGGDLGLRLAVTNSSIATYNA